MRSSPSRSGGSRSTAGHRPVRRSRGIPLPLRVVLAVAIVLMGGLVLYVATGGLGQIVGGLGDLVGNFVGQITATPSPSATTRLDPDAPILAGPVEPYTNQPQIDIVATLPSGSVGVRGATARLYLALEGQAPAPIDEQPIGSTPRLVFAGVALTPGVNRFSATIIHGGVESIPSADIEYVLDVEPPVVTIVGPADGSTVNGDNVSIAGSTQPRTHLSARNVTAATTSTATADPDGSFRLVVPLENGPNEIRITAVDPAGNTTEQTLTIRKGTGKLTADLTASTYRLRRSDLPTDLEVRVQVDDPDGAPLEGATVTFTLQIPGLQAFVQTTTTAADGTASYRTTIPKGALAGGGLAAVLVDAGEYGEISDRSVITVD